MKKNLCVFISKNSKPDLYVNIIGYLMMKFKEENIAKIFLLNVFDFPFERGLEQKRVGIVEENILKQIDALADGQYYEWHWKNGAFDPNSPIDIKVEDYFRDIYKSISKRLKRVGINSLTIYEEDIERDLDEIMHINDNDFIFDLTGLANRYFVEVAMFLQAKKYSISVFEVIRELARDHTDLLHCLKKTDIRYNELSPGNYRVIHAQNRDFPQQGIDNKLVSKQEEWVNALSAGKTSEVIQDVIEYFKKANDVKGLSEIIMISSRWHELESKQGVVNHENYTLTENSIRNSLIRLVLGSQSAEK